MSEHYLHIPHVEPGTTCPTCAQYVPIPKAVREPSDPRNKSQLNLTFKNEGEKQAYLDLEQQQRERLIGWHLADPDNTPAFNIRTPRSLIVVNVGIQWLELTR